MTESSVMGNTRERSAAPFHKLQRRRFIARSKTESLESHIYGVVLKGRSASVVLGRRQRLCNGAHSSAVGPNGRELRDDFSA